MAHSQAQYIGLPPALDGVAPPKVRCCSCCCCCCRSSFCCYCCSWWWCSVVLVRNLLTPPSPPPQSKGATFVYFRNVLAVPAGVASAVIQVRRLMLVLLVLVLLLLLLLLLLLVLLMQAVIQVHAVNSDPLLSAYKLYIEGKLVNLGPGRYIRIHAM